MQKKIARFRQFAVVVLAVTLAVILWGAFVRATGAGAGCGNHWPNCNGQIIPRSPSVKTIIEFTHRLTSGASLICIVVQLIWAFRLFPKRHVVRKLAATVFGLIVTEALIGAGLVKFEMVAGNIAVARAYWMAAHLCNTFALLAAILLVVDRAGRSSVGDAIVAAPFKLRGAPPLEGIGRGHLRGLQFALAAVVLVAMSGAIVALGDTLFPAKSLAEGMAADASPSAHLFVRLRVVHPAIAVLTGLLVTVLAGVLAGKDDGRSVAGRRLRRRASFAGAFALLQLAIGFTNLLLLAPVAVQIVHLLFADLVWLALVALTADVVGLVPRALPIARDAQRAVGASAR